MASIKDQLISLGERRRDLRKHIRPVLAKLEGRKTAGIEHDAQELATSYVSLSPYMEHVSQQMKNLKGTEHKDLSLAFAKMDGLFSQLVEDSQEVQQQMNGALSRLHQAQRQHERAKKKLEDERKALVSELESRKKETEKLLEDAEGGDERYLRNIWRWLNDAGGVLGKDIDFK